MTFSNVCFTDNEFVGSGVVVVEGSIDDFTSSNVTGTVDLTLDCPYASIGFTSCVDYDSDTCSASNPSDSTDTPVPVPVVMAPVSDAAPTIGEKSGCIPSQIKVSLVLLTMSVVLAL